MFCVIVLLLGVWQVEGQGCQMIPQVLAEESGEYVIAAIFNIGKVPTALSHPSFYLIPLSLFFSFSLSLSL